MEAKVNFTVVGIFVLTLGAALIGGVLWLSSGKYFGQSYAIYRCYMTDSVAGLNLNAPVKYHGVDVGTVRAIALNPANTEEVQLTLAISRGTPVKEDTVAILQTQGLTGIAYVELTAGGKDSRLLTARPGEEYPVIKSGPSLLTRLETTVTALIANLTRTTESFNALLDEKNRREISATIADLATVSRTLAARSPSIDAGLANAARAMENTAKFTDDLPRLAQRIERSADRLDAMADAVARAGGSATQTLDSTRSDLQQFTTEGLPEVRELVAELRELTGTLRRVGSDLERNPSELVWGRQPGKRGPGE
ncbi:MAG TPA: MlaD family protein [Casimicrobiaceae bacterium]|nr:MlaD family protein [Casimicrobiaceae bacterium]